ncbi:MAG: hypothetical protein NTV68_09430 [Methanomicrobiales archaeon]|nr:hypothetical protein [Methanomicrobiales archaeon]
MTENQLKVRSQYALGMPNIDRNSTDKFQGTPDEVRKLPEARFHQRDICGLDQHIRAGYHHRKIREDLFLPG